MILLLLSLGACARAPDSVGVETVVPVESVPGLTRHDVFIATTRAPSDDTAQFFSGDRSLKVRYASVDVTIPPGHVPGELERTKADVPDPRRHFTIQNPVAYDGSSQFQRDLVQALKNRPPSGRNVLIFVHGYNTTLTDGILQVAQFIEDSGYDGIPILFSWASGGELTKYVYDLNSVLVARDGLASMLGVMDSSAIQHYDVLAHSMGTLLTMETGRQIALTSGINPTGKTRNVILASPDIDIDLFVSQLQRIPEDYRSFVVMVSSDDKALKASRLVAGGVARTGAAPVEVLNELGVIAIDLSEVDDQSSLSHSKFRDSPQIVQVIGEGMRTRSTFGESNETRSGIVRTGTDGVLELFGLGG
ncbi:MAG: alpha/beta hydrolase [Pseudomonadota bacterium]